MSLTYASGADIPVDVVVPLDVVASVVVTVDGDVADSAPPPHAANSTPAIQTAAAGRRTRVNR